MFKKGFTLAEVLIAIGIVGVIAAISIPTFVSNTQNQTNASKLASVMSDVETAFTSMIASEGVDDLTETEFYQAFKDAPESSEAESLFGNYLKLAGSGKVNDYYGSTYLPHKDINGASLSVSYANPKIIYQTKNGALLLLSTTTYTITEEKAKNAGISTTQCAMFITIDVNGGEKPNISARDTFVFMVAGDGTIHPAGGKVYSQFVPMFGVWTNQGAGFGCTGSKRSMGCTARLVENNFKVDY